MNRLDSEMGWVRGHRDGLVALLDLLVWIVVVLILPTALGLEAGSESIAGRLVVGLAAGCVSVLVGRRVGLYSIWALGSPTGTLRLTVPVLAGALVAGLVATALGFGRAILLCVCSALVAFAAQTIARVAWRAHRDKMNSLLRAKGEPMIIFGAGFGGAHIAEALSQEIGRYRVVAMLDDAERVHGRKIGGIAVAGGREKLGALVEEHSAKHLLIAIPSARSGLIRELTDLGRSFGLHVSVLPTMTEVMSRGGVVSASDIRDVTPADLLGRKQVDLDLHQCGRYVAGKTILVTGAGGSIGSELCRQLARLDPRKVLMLDRDESALHALQLSMEGRALLDDDSLIVADIRDRDRMAAVFGTWHPEIVFHTAALKHLTLLEAAPGEGFKTNVGGTHNLLEEASAHEAMRFINVSTDKAADASSVLGFTKRLAERLTANKSQNPDRQYLSVRFGNVLGSRGSVLDAFAKQIEMDEPLTVTHPEIERYFMTVEEAVGLVIAAGDIGRTGEVMILEMGKPVKIVDVARQMIESSGKNLDIEITGLRPGEKMTERLTGVEEPVVLNETGLMWHATCPPVGWSDICDLALIADDDLLRAELRDAAEYKPIRPTPITSPVRTFLSPPDMTGAERSSLLDAFDSGWIAPTGPSVVEFERHLVDYLDVPAALVLSSGSAGLHLALHLHGIGPGDEVVVQTATFAASAFAVLQTGATPIFCDSDARTGNLDPVLLAEFLSSRERMGRLPAAVVTVDLYGFCADYDTIKPLCESYGIPLIQDAAEALGSLACGRHAGAHGDFGVLSFNGNKIITTGGGGALLGDIDQIEHARKLSTQAREPLPHFEHVERGFNYRMSNLLAAVGVAQMGRLESIIERRSEISAFYRSEIEVSWFPTGVTDRPNSWLNVAELPDGIAPELVCDALNAHGIEARRAWKPMHQQPVFAGAEQIGGRCSDRLFERGICLPSGATLSDATVERIAAVVNDTITVTSTLAVS
ncbi:MAG: SDR family NAD(P)-dependent oxidoreductase [Actinomycetia bacterium]|nr:SDR family NAD(P)-dependent oxidoreductase [Actinomycetes bacterium]